MKTTLKIALLVMVGMLTCAVQSQAGGLRFGVSFGNGCYGRNVHYVNNCNYGYGYRNTQFRPQYINVGAMMPAIPVVVEQPQVIYVERPQPQVVYVERQEPPAAVFITPKPSTSVSVSLRVGSRW